MNLTITKTPTGITLTVDAEAQEALTGLTSDHPNEMYDLFEPYSCNNSYTLFDSANGNPFVGLTEAPCIAESMGTDDEGERKVVGDFYYYNYYMITSYVEELATTGKTFFHLVK